MSEIKKVKISNAKVSYNKVEEETKKSKGYDYFHEPYPNVYLLAKKKSGKTTVIENILKKCSGKNTRFIFIVSTINKDKTWLRITDYFDLKGHDVEAYDDLKDDDGSNVIQNFLDEEKKNAEVEQKGSGLVPAGITPIQQKLKFKMTTIKPQIVGGNEPKKEPPKPGVGAPGHKEKLLYPKTIIVLDDLGSQMRDKSIAQLLKTNRHYKSMVILSGQNLEDLMPEQIRNLDYALCFPKIPEEKMLKLKSNMLLDIDDETFLKMYSDATKDPYNFFYIGREKEDIYRKNFNEAYEI